LRVFAACKFASDRNWRKYKIFSRQARQVRKGHAAQAENKFDLLTWRSLRALREIFPFFLVAASPRWDLCGKHSWPPYFAAFAFFAANFFSFGCGSAALGLRAESFFFRLRLCRVGN